MRSRYDAVIYGATLAGIMAATRLARRGYRSLVLEPTGHVGGIVAGGLVKTDTPGDLAALGGLTRAAFFGAIGAEYGADGPRYLFEPKVASRVAARLLAEAGADVVLNYRLHGAAQVRLAGRAITAILVDDAWAEASFFVDASYEGDLMAAAGVPYTVGREAAETYDESYAGFRPGSAYRRSGFGAPGYPVRTVPTGTEGSPDGKVQAYNFRGVLTKSADRIPFWKPDGYDPALFTHLRQQVETRGIAGLSSIVTHTALLPNGKYQTNQGLFFGFDLPGASWDYPDAGWQRRDEIVAEHVRWHQGQLYFSSHDPSVPAAYREDTARFGYAPDEFTDSPYGGGFPHALYIREGRRLRGAATLTQHDLLAPNHTKATAVCRWQYHMDCHIVQYYPGDDGMIVGEGPLAGSTANPATDVYQLPAEVLFPARGGITNLVVPVCFSASHVGYSSARMEPNFGMLGEAAGELAAQAIGTGAPVQDYAYPELAKALAEYGTVL